MGTGGNHLAADTGPAPEWFARPDPRPHADADPARDGAGLRFSCTLCGNCCSGPEGYVLVSDAEVIALARRLGLSTDEFIARFTHTTPEGRSLTERMAPDGQSRDCIFLDREKLPGKAVCGVYEDRPMQCRTWPFWPSVLRSRESWERAKRVCPGIDKGPIHTLVQIRVQRDAFKI